MKARAADLAIHPEPLVVPLLGEHAETIDAIAVGLALVRDRVPFAGDYPAAVDIVGAFFPETQDTTRSTRRLAEILLSHLITGSIDHDLARERADLLGTLTAEGARARLRMSRRRRDAAIDDASELLDEIALELHDRHCTVDGDPDGSFKLVIEPASAVEAAVSLLGRLLERAELFMAGDENLALERAASQWYFSRWSAGSFGADPIVDEFPRAVREQEWSLVSRDTLSLDEPAIVSLIAEDERGDVPPRQRALVEALQQSTVGVFEVESIDAPIVVVRHIADGATYRVHEYFDEVDLEPGEMLFGRLIPLDDSRWIRSQSTLVVDSQDDDFRQAIVNTLTTFGDQYATAIVVEALISNAVYNIDVPLSPSPATTVNEARAALVETSAFLEEIGIFDVETAFEQSIDGAESPLDNPVLDTFGLGIDDTFTEWLGALSAQAALDDKPPKAKRKHHKKKRKRR